MKNENQADKSISLNTLISILIAVTFLILVVSGAAVIMVVRPLAENLTLALRTGLSPQAAVSSLMTGVITRLSVGIGVAVVLQLTAIVLCMRILLRRVHNLEAIGAQLAEGDLTATTTLRSRDAIGRLARSLNIAVHNLNTIAVRILQAVRAGSSSASDLTVQIQAAAEAGDAIGTNAQHIRSQVSDLSGQISSASGAIEEIMATIISLGNQINTQAAQVEETSAAVNEMGASIDSVARIAGERKTQAAALVKVTQDGGEQVRETLEVMELVHSGIDAMSEVLSVIDGIAGQTNLLAMNAAIEAAHAGDAGKGFAVVSDEIRRLAESTSENSRTIGSSLQETIQQIEAALHSSARAEKSFEEIQVEVNQVADAFHEIARSTDELSVGGSQMVSSIQELSSVTEVIRNGAVEIQSGAEDVTRSLQGITAIARETDSDVAGITDSVGQLSDTVRKIAMVNEKNQANVDRLNNEVSSLRVDEQTVSEATDIDTLLEDIEEL
ncbi:MAG: methyl-accepting chemotaxis protein [Spirochaeta sp.]